MSIVDTSNTMMISAAGLKAQSTRMRIIAENIANSSTTGTSPGADPYRRQIPVFQQVMDRHLGMKVITAEQPIPDKSDFNLKFDPSHPAANAQGYVKTSNVKPLTEALDMKEAQRSYEANLSVIDATRSIEKQTIDLLRA